MNKPVYLGLSILDLSKTKMYEFRYDYVKPNYGENGKQMTFTKILQKILKKDLILPVLKQIDHYKQEKIKKVIVLMKHELGGQMINFFFGLRANTYR